MIDDVKSSLDTCNGGQDDSARWDSPEVLGAFNGGSFATIASDVHSFAMQSPFLLDFNGEAGIPRRTLDKKGLDDAVWELMTRCWSHMPSDRPTMQAVTAELDVIWPEESAGLA